MTVLSGYMSAVGGGGGGGGGGGKALPPRLCFKEEKVKA